MHARPSSFDHAARVVDDAPDVCGENWHHCLVRATHHHAVKILKVGLIAEIDPVFDKSMAAAPLSCMFQWLPRLCSDAMICVIEFRAAGSHAHGWLLNWKWVMDHQRRAE